MEIEKRLLDIVLICLISKRCLPVVGIRAAVDGFFLRELFLYSYIL